jgi:hypothetical protein
MGNSYLNRGAKMIAQSTGEIQTRECRAGSTCSSWNKIPADLWGTIELPQTLHHSAIEVPLFTNEINGSFQYTTAMRGNLLTGSLTVFFDRGNLLLQWDFDRDEKTWPIDRDQYAPAAHGGFSPLSIVCNLAQRTSVVSGCRYISRGLWGTYPIYLMTTLDGTTNVQIETSPNMVIGKDCFEVSTGDTAAELSSIRMPPNLQPTLQYIVRGSL